MKEKHSTPPIFSDELMVFVIKMTLSMYCFVRIPDILNDKDNSIDVLSRTYS